MSRNGTSAIYKSTYYLGIVHVKLATNRKLRGVLTYLPNLEVLCLEHIWNTRSVTTISSLRLRPSGDQKYIPMNPLDLGTLRKSLRTIWRSCSWLGLHPLLSLIFHKFMYKYEAKPPPNLIIFYTLHHSQTKNISEHNMFRFTPLKLYINCNRGIRGSTVIGNNC